MARSVRDEQVRPVLHHVHLITQLAVERKIVVRPAQTLTVTERHTERTEVLVLIRLGLRQLLVVIAVTGVVVIIRIGVIEVLVRLLVTARVTGLVGEIDTCAQAVRALTAEPRLQEREARRRYNRYRSYAR